MGTHWRNKLLAAQPQFVVPASGTICGRVANADSRPRACNRCIPLSLVIPTRVTDVLNQHRNTTSKHLRRCPKIPTLK